eukprot:3433754-Pleurochrysis_carterae.AAC.2
MAAASHPTLITCRAPRFDADEWLGEAIPPLSSAFAFEVSTHHIRLRTELSLQLRALLNGSYACQCVSTFPMCRAPADHCAFPIPALLCSSFWRSRVPPLLGTAH